MRVGRMVALGLSVCVAASTVGSARQAHMNPMVDLLAQKRPIFGLYAPPARERQGFGRRGAAPDPSAPPPVTRTPAERATETLRYTLSDFVFDGSMEGGVDRGIEAYTAFVEALSDAGAVVKSPAPRLPYPLVVKTPLIAPDPATAVTNISRQLNLGVSGIMFVGVESAAEVRQGLAAMRFRSKGGTRPDGVGTAPAYWGLSEAAYREKADLWPLSPSGELVNWTIVESKEGLAHVREIAAVPGIGVLWPGAGTLRQVFTTTDADGQRVFDSEGWEHAIQQVLAACKEFHVPCGYPATPADIEMRMQQGFSVFVMNWGDAGFQAIDIGRRVGGR